MLARARTAALVVLLGAFAVTVLAGWVASVLTAVAVDQPPTGDLGTFVLWLAVAQLAVLGVVALVAYILAQRSTRSIEEIFRLEDRVMRAVAHEVHNPITRMLVLAEEGLTVGRDPAATLRQVIDETQALSEFIDDLAESVRVMAGDIPLSPTAVRLDETVAIPPTRVRLGEAELRLEAQPVIVTGNQRLLRLAVVNLVNNAAQHAYGGGHGVITIRTDQRGVSVIDAGPGMDPTQIREVLASPRAAMSRRLAGLGLPFVNWVAEAHRGRLALVNRPEGGLEARLELPAVPADPDAS